MPASKKPRKKYRPKPVYSNPVAVATTLCSTLRPGEIQRIQLTAHAAMTAMVRGEGGKADWSNTADALNMTLILAQTRFDNAYQDELLDARDAHCACLERYVEKGRFGYTGEELQAMNLALEIHDEILGQVSIRELEDAVRECRKRIAGGMVVNDIAAARKAHTTEGAPA